MVMILTYLISSMNQVYGSITNFISVWCWTANFNSLACEVEVDKLFSLLYKDTQILKSGKLFNFIKVWSINLRQMKSNFESTNT